MHGLINIDLIDKFKLQTKFLQLNFVITIKLHRILKFICHQDCVTTFNIDNNCSLDVSCHYVYVFLLQYNVQSNLDVSHSEESKSRISRNNFKFPAKFLLIQYNFTSDDLNSDKSKSHLDRISKLINPDVSNSTNWWKY